MTIRDRDTLQQKRIPQSDIPGRLEIAKLLGFRHTTSMIRVRHTVPHILHYDIDVPHRVSNSYLCGRIHDSYMIYGISSLRLLPKNISDVITKLVMENLTFDELNYQSQEEFLLLHTE